MKSKRWFSVIGLCFVLLFVFWLLRPALTQAQGVPHFNQISWTLSPTSGVTSQKVYRGTVSGGPYSALATLNGTVTTYQDTATTQGQLHCYVLTALVGTNESVFSGEVCATDKGTNVNPQTGPAVTSQQ